MQLVAAPFPRWVACISKTGHFRPLYVSLFGAVDLISIHLGFGWAWPLDHGRGFVHHP